ncbi:sulfotransferase domain-containing protein [Cyanobacterium aponinum FACHB-4101]|uniref:sulfotransferase domain-containing protein n=1 Tax=Cyanobacterium aponinum TaxID=379064 RepID=UPI001681675C|nr:sulfotransferase domain-containing protein [Cyanobacterium aponinum]MBD2394965.1 sulfotransferase domain-containing protein [Cyanobacterium aponinum FACHB-4101]
MTKFSLDFIGIGPQKTGSTWLHEVLCQHPLILLPQGTKETMFFDRYYDKGLNWYGDYFSKANNKEQKLGEIGPSYYDCEKSIDRIHSLNPKCKIIITIRNPITKAISLHHHHLNKGRVSSVFSEAVIKMPKIITSGHYAQYIPQWMSKFGEEQVKLIFLDDIKANPKQVWLEVCEFLEIDAIDLPDVAHKKINEKKISKYPWLAKIGVEVAIKMREYKMHNLVEKLKKIGLNSIYSGGESRIIPLTDKEYQDLATLYYDDIKFLEQVTSRDLSSWQKQK